MWKYSEPNAYNSISLHDCRTDSIVLERNDLILHFPDGFWIMPNSVHNDLDRPVKTGPAQLCFRDVYASAPFDAINVYKTLRVFRKPIFCRRLQPEYIDFLKLFGRGRYELEFITEYHASISSLYQCWIWKKNRGVEAECQFEISAQAIEYCWNQIFYDRIW